jgi:ankyrin repeat protein
VSDEYDWDKEWERRLRRMPALMRAAWRGDLPRLLAALRRGADPNGPVAGSHPLVAAVAGGSLEVVRALLDAGAAPDSPGPGGGALYTAAGFARAEIVGLLLERGADPNAAGFRKRTALHRATEHVGAESAGAVASTVALLLSAGADPNAADSAGRTPLLNCCEHERLDAARLLLDHGADPNRADSRGRRPLLGAAQYGDADHPLVALLLERGADPRGPGGVPLVARRDASLAEQWDAHWGRVLCDGWERGYALMGLNPGIEPLLSVVQAGLGHRVLLPGNGCSLLPHALAHAGCAVTALDISRVAGEAVRGASLSEEDLKHWFTAYKEVPDDMWGRVHVPDPEASLERVRRSAVPGGSVTCVTGDVLTWESAVRFDCLYDDRLLMLLPIETWPAVAARYRELLTPGGRCVVETINLGGGDPRVVTPEQLAMTAAFKGAGFRTARRLHLTRPSRRPLVALIHSTG